MNKLKFWVKKFFLLTILIYINLSCISIYIIVGLLWFYGILHITIYQPITALLIIHTVFTLLSIFYSFYINFRYFSEKLIKSYNKEIEKSTKHNQKIDLTHIKKFSNIKDYKRKSD